MFDSDSAGHAGERGRGSCAQQLWLAVATAALIALTPLAAGAGQDADMARDAGIGWGAAIGSLVYAPLKVVYATGGLLVGGLAYVFSGGDEDVARTVITPAVLGDYVVTTEHVRGQRPLEFLGREPGYASDYAAAWDEQDTETRDDSGDVDVAAAPDGW